MIGLLSLSWLTLVGTPIHAQVTNCPVVSMTITATPSTDLPIPNLYKYCVTGVWDVGQSGLSHIDVLLFLEGCECACDQNLIQFIQPAGTSTGMNSLGLPCIVDYLGEYLCQGDPTVPADLRKPTVKWDAVTGPNGCEPGTTGTGTWCFYTQLPPAPFSVSPNSIAIKHGNQVCVGAVSGTLPMCRCTVPTLSSTWGIIKAAYR